MKEFLKDITGGFDIVLVVKQGVEDISFYDLRHSVKGLLLRASNKGALNLSRQLTP